MEPALDIAQADMPSFVKRMGLERALENDATVSWISPAQYPEATLAAERTRKGIADGETIAIFGDYDCDGITSTAQMLRFFRRNGVEPIVRLPHRMHDGYGLKMKHVEEFANAGVTLLFTVDTGVASHAEIETAKAKGMDVIVLDHHHFTQRPPAHAVLHPSLAQHPTPHPPSAAGVVFAFLHELEKDMWAGREEDLALAAIGTIADVVTLRGDNRRLVTEGLAAMNRLAPSPLQQMLASVSRGQRLTSTDVAFRVAPRINAAGRMADPTLALSAILEGGDGMQTLEQLNVERQAETARCIEHALQSIDPTGTLDHASLPAFLCVASEDYPPGILGLISGKLTERFGRPSMAANIKGEDCVASLRSTPFYHVTEGLRRIASLLATFGGHAQAAGCSFKKENLADIARTMDEDVRSKVSQDELVPTLAIDATLPIHAVSVPFCSSLSQLEPFGQGNSEPLFLSRGVTLSFPRTVGGEGQHLQAYAAHCKLIGFNLGRFIDHINKPVDLVYRLNVDTWNGKANPQLMLQDLRLAA